MTTTLHYIYVLKDENDNIFYVGKTCRPTHRFSRHLRNIRDGSTYPVHNKLRKVIRLKGNSKNIYEVIESDIPESKIDIREMFYIKKFRQQGLKLKNLTDGGEGGKGITAEIVAKIVAKNKGKKRTPEQKKRISDAKLGIPFTDQHKKSLKKAWKTRVLPTDWGEMMSRLNRGKINTKKFVVLSPTNERIVTENGLTDFCRSHNLSVQNLHKTLNGERRHHKGWRIVEST